MLYRYRKELRSAWFRFNARGIYNTAPVLCDPDGPAAFVSQVCHRDLAMYLLAVKSLAMYLRPSRVFIINDGSLTDPDIRILRSHITRLEILSVTSVNNAVCPKGGTWERLLFISDLVSSSYAIQIDCDTLTLKSPAHVQSHVTDGVSFTLGEWPGQQIVLAQESADDVAQRETDGAGHIQFVAEANLSKLASDKPLRYVRGCSGFAGFAKGSFSRNAVERFSTEMAGIVGQAKWSEWGSEQVTSNFIIANTQRAAVLPFPEYCFHSPNIEVDAASFVHFIGTYRFHGGRYARLANRVIGELGDSARR